MSLRKKTLSGFKWSYIGVFFQSFLQLAVLAVLARLLSPDDFGILSVSFIFINIAKLISEVGVGPAIVQRKNLTNEHINSGLIFSSFMGFLVYMIFYFISKDLSLFFEKKELEIILKVIALNFIINGLLVAPLSLLRKKMKFKEITIINITSYLIGYGFIGIGMALAGYGVWALVFASITQNIIMLLLSFYYNPLRITLKFSKRHLIELLNFGGGFTIGRVFNYLALNGDNFVIGKFLGTYYLGIYSRAYAILTLPARYFSSIFDRVLFPAFSEIQDRKEKIREVFLNSTQFIFFFSALAGVFIFIYAKYIVLILLGPKWLDVIPLIKIMAFGIPFRTTYKLSDAISRALGTVYKRAWRQGVYAFMIIGGAFIGSVYKNMNIVAGFIVFSLFVIYLLMSNLTVKSLDIKIKEFLFSHIPAIVFISIMFIIYLLLNLTVWKGIMNLTYYVEITVLAIIVFFIITNLKKSFKFYSLCWFLNKGGISLLSFFKKILKCKGKQ